MDSGYVSNVLSCECEPSINYCNDTWEKVIGNKILAQPMDSPKKFKRYCKYNNVKIQDYDPEFYMRYIGMDAMTFLIPSSESCLKQGTPEKNLF